MKFEQGLLELRKGSKENRIGSKNENERFVCNREFYVLFIS